MKLPPWHIWHDLRTEAGESAAELQAIAEVEHELEGSEPVLILDPPSDRRGVLDRLVDGGFLERETRAVCPLGHRVSEEQLAQRRCGECGFSFEHDSPKEQIAYSRPGRRSRDTRWVVTIHGMNTRGAWQEEFTWRLARLYGYSVPVAIYKYGRILVSPLLYFRQQVYVDRLLERLVKLSTEMKAEGYGGRPDIIAHSFGTLILYRALELARERGLELTVGRVILTGSAVPPDFDWSPLLARRVEKVLCHTAGKDRIVPLAHFFVPYAGPSGTRGFNDRQAVFHAHEPDFGHSGCFDVERASADPHYDNPHDRVMRRVWGPFLTAAEEDLPEWQQRQSVPALRRWRPFKGRPLTFLFKYGILLALVGTLLLLVAALVLGFPEAWSRLKELL